MTSREDRTIDRTPRRPRPDHAPPSCSDSLVDGRPQAPQLKLEDLNAYYGYAGHQGRHARLAANQVTAMIGPSGCGKSTFVRCLNRMHEEIPGARAEGEILLDGDDIYGPDVDVGSDSPARSAWCSRSRTRSRRCRSSTTSPPGLRLPGVKGVDEEPSSGRCAARPVGRGQGPPRHAGISLSGGQQQRLCIARTLAVEPEVILMDEPRSALDPIATARIEELIDELKQRYTIVIVTHNMQQAARVADTTAFFLLGELVEHAPTTTVFMNLSDSRTEQYITGKFG